jgi:hypothetical protein
MSAHFGKSIAYFRVSTDRQGKSGLGLDAQREAVMSYLNGGSWTLVSEFTEVESGSAARTGRSSPPPSRPAKSRKPRALRGRRGCGGRCGRVSDVAFKGGGIPDEPCSALFPHGVGIDEAGDGRGPPSHDPV